MTGKKVVVVLTYLEGPTIQKYLMLLMGIFKRRAYNGENVSECVQTMLREYCRPLTSTCEIKASRAPRSLVYPLYGLQEHLAVRKFPPKLNAMKILNEICGPAMIPGLFITMCESMDSHRQSFVLHAQARC
ncbi:hypothetical protein AB6A40_010468 [Gnathostoma spinigerum]|uniref:Uncharacterized protein n=1 Tax=Gnathostoma spinigerum TaxID=75299 RepID=A0ABD6EUX0_9BILA